MRVIASQLRIFMEINLNDLCANAVDTLSNHFIAKSCKKLQKAEKVGWIRTSEENCINLALWPNG